MTIISTGVTFPGAIASVEAGSDWQFTDVNNMLLSDDAYASVTWAVDDDASWFNSFYDFGFSAIPATAQLLGVEVYVELNTDSANNWVCRARLVSRGSDITGGDWFLGQGFSDDFMQAALPDGNAPADATLTLGTGSGLWGGPENGGDWAIDSTDFGVAVWFARTAAGTITTLQVDSISMNITYFIPRSTVQHIGAGA